MSFEELEREVRQDLMTERWKRFRPGIIALVVSTLVAVIGYKGYQYYEQQQQLAAAEIYYNATQILVQDREAGLVALEQVMQNKSALGYQTLAQLRLAAEYVDAEDFAPARTILLDLADNVDTPDIFIALATLQATLMPADAETNANLNKRLVPLLTDDNPWRHSARFAAVELALKNNDNAKAREILQQSLDDRSTPRVNRTRIEKLLSLIN